MQRVTFILAGMTAAIMSFSASAHQHGEHADVAFTGHERELKELEFSRCWVRLVPGDRPSAAYFDLKNKADKAITLLAARADGFNDVMLHETISGAMQMVNEVLIEANESISFKPKGNHVMLTPESTDTVAVGDTITMQFKFKDEQMASTECLVKPINSLSFED